jgi:hypothetical protein
MLSVLVVAVAGALVVAPSQTKPAEAYTTSISPTQAWDAAKAAAGNMPIKRVDINVWYACGLQYGGPLATMQAYPMSWSDPYSWRCYRVTSWVPYRLAYLGGVDLGRYCRYYHPATPVARLTEPWAGAQGWSCTALYA